MMFGFDNFHSPFRAFQVVLVEKEFTCNAGDRSRKCEFSPWVLEKEMATHFTILAWRIPWKGEPGGLQSMGLHRVGYD